MSSLCGGIGAFDGPATQTCECFSAESLIRSRRISSGVDRCNPIDNSRIDGFSHLARI